MQSAQSHMDALKAKLDSFETGSFYWTPTQRAILKSMSEALCSESTVDLAVHRRSQVTTAATHFMAASMLTVPGFDGVWFSKSRYESDKIIACVRDILQSNGASFEVDNAERICVNIDDDKRSFQIFPSSSRNIRGVGGNFLFIDEASYTDEQMVHEVIVPLLALRNTRLVIGSTLGEDAPEWLEHARASSSTRRVEIHAVCASCLAAGQVTPCVHRVDRKFSYL